MTVLIDKRDALYDIVFFDYVRDIEYKITYLIKATGTTDTIEVNYNGATTLHDREFRKFMLKLAKKKAGI